MNIFLVVIEYFTDLKRFGFGILRGLCAHEICDMCFPQDEFLNQRVRILQAFLGVILNIIMKSHISDVSLQRVRLCCNKTLTTNVAKGYLKL